MYDEYVFQNMSALPGEMIVNNRLLIPAFAFGEGEQKSMLFKTFYILQYIVLIRRLHENKHLFCIF